MGVTWSEQDKKLILTTAHSAYCLGIDSEGNVQHLYWGTRLPDVEDYPHCHALAQTIGKEVQPGHPKDFFYPFEVDKAVINEEYTGWGGLNFVEPCLKVNFPDGVRDVVLKYHTHELNPVDDGLMVTLKDAYYPFFVHLHYRVFAETDIIVRWTEIENRCDGNVQLENAQSAVWYAPVGQSYRLSHLTGRWGDEFNLKQVPIEQGKKMLESRRGITSHHETPWFALDPDGATTEHCGPVWFGTLAWSGNWKMVVEYTSNLQMRVTAGIHDFDFAWELKPGETFKTPECIGGYSQDGFGGASRQLHRYALQHVYPEAYRTAPWPVFYNTWEAHFFDIDEQKLIALAEKAAHLGIEVFHVDDGWFGTRRNEYSGLGDWTVSLEKFPNGLKPLVEKVKALGMELGLWIEPENINLDSEIHRAHPDWVYGFSTREHSIQRESVVLNLGREDVREHLWNCISDLIREYGISVFKWDMNRHLSEVGWDGLPAEKQKELWVRHVHGVYEIKARIRQEFPHVSIECCSGGGGRVDYGILKYCEVALPSDNHDPLSRLRIQEGFSQVFPAKAMGSWVTDVPSPLTNRSLSLKFMFHVAMTGALGIQNNLLRWNEDQTEYARKMVSLYKEIRPTIQNGDLYRLNSLRKDHLAALQYVDQAAEHSVIFAFMYTNSARDTAVNNIYPWGSPHFTFRLYPKGLVEEQRYSINGDSTLRSGASLMHVGLEVELEGDGDSLLIRIDAADS
jgi:alpha-galactosidase